MVVVDFSREHLILDFAKNKEDSNEKSFNLYSQIETSVTCSFIMQCIISDGSFVPQLRRMSRVYQTEATGHAD